MRGLRILWVIVIAILSVPASADEWEEALAAYAADDFARAIELMTPLAEKGHVLAQNKLAHIYWYGDGVPVDRDASLAWNLRAAEVDDPVAQFNLAIEYLRGEIVPKDAEKAFELLQSAAANGDAMAHYNLHYMFTRGKGTEADRVAGLSHLIQAAKLGDSRGQVSLAYHYLEGTMGLPVDYGRALDLLRRAADQRDPSGMAAAGSLLSDSQMVEPDLEQAVIYLRAAMLDGCWGVSQELHAIMSSLPMDALLASDRKLAEWLAAHPPAEPHTHRELPPACLELPD